MINHLEKRVITEFFSINEKSYGSLYVYRLKIGGGQLKSIGGRLAYRFRKIIGGFWNFSDNMLISNKFIAVEKATEILKKLWETGDKNFLDLHEIKFSRNAKPSVKAFADYAANFLKYCYSREIKIIIGKHQVSDGNVIVKRRINIRGWRIFNSPAVSISISSNMYHTETLDKYLAKIKNLKDIIGIPVTDILNSHKGEITAVIGELKQHRIRLLNYKLRPEIREKIIDASDNEFVVKIASHKSKQQTYDYIASTLYPSVTLENAKHFEADASILSSKLTFQPQTRMSIINSLVSKFSEHIGENYNSEVMGDYFKTGKEIGFKNEIQYGNEHVCSFNDYKIRKLKKYGLFKKTTKFIYNPEMKVCVLSGISKHIVDDFWLKIKNELSSLQFKPIFEEYIHLPDFKSITIEEEVKKLSNKDFDVIMGLFPNRSINPDQHDIVYDKETIYIKCKSRLLNLDITESQFIFENTIKYKLGFALANVILGILSKTGNIPFVLPEPLSFADFFVGIDISREKKKKLNGTMNYAAIVRVYGQTGLLDTYDIREKNIEGETIPKKFIEDVFSKSKFKNKTIMIHRDGFFRGNEIEDFKEVGRQIGTKFLFVEIIKRYAPRIYQELNGDIVNPDEGTIFYLGKKEALIINNKVNGKRTVQPLRIRVFGNTSLDQAIISVMALRMMNFGSTKPIKLPVTVHFSDVISGLFRRGIKPRLNSGTKQWW